MKLTNHEGLRASGRLGLLLMELCLMSMWMGSVVHAQAFSTTTVQGTVYLANGQPGTGTLVVSWPTFTTSNGQVVAAESMTVAVAPDGFVSVNLAPNQGAAPAGLYYTATFYMSDGSVNTQYWVVPATTSATLGQVQAQVMPAAQAVQTVSKAYVDQALESLAGGVLTITGTTMTGPLTLCCDPTTPLQAADKHYVDAATAQAVPLAGGTLTGPLTATKIGALYQVDQFAGADFGAKLGACLSGLSATQGGTCDARNFSGTLGMGSALTIATANATVLLPCATISTANQVVVTAGTRNVTLRGCALRGASTASGSQGGTVFYYSGTGAMVQVGDPTYAADTSGFHLDNAVINITAATSASAQGLAAYRTQELDLESSYFLGNSNQTGMTLDGTGNYTGGTFYDNEFTGFQTAVNAIGHQITNPATTDWVNASTFVRLHIDCPTSSGNPISGTYGINLQQGDGNTFTGGDVEGCATALHLGANAQNNTIVGLRNENSTNQVVADAGSSYNNWMTGGTMFTGQLTDNGTRNSFLDTFHRSFNGLNGDWYGSQKDATVTNHLRLGTGAGNERGLMNEIQTDYGYRWMYGFTDATAGEQYYLIQDLLNNVNRISVGQYNNGQSSTNNQTVINSAGTGAVVLNGSNNSGTGGVVIGSGGASPATVATINNAGNAQFTGTLLVGGTSQSTGTMTVRNNADAEVDYYLWPGVTTSQKGSYTYKDWNGNSQWYMVKDASNNWALNSATGGLDSFKAYQSSNSGDTYIDASNSTGVVRVNYETGSGTQFKVYGGNSGSLYASFTGTTSIQFPGLAAGSGYNCLQIDNSGYVTNTGSACGAGGSGGSGTVNSGTSGQIAYYNGTGTVLSGTNTVTALSASLGTINNTCMADQQTGNDMGAKIAACNTALASTGGIIDATGLLGTQYASVGFTIGPGLPTTTSAPSNSVTLKLGYVTLIAGDEIKLSPFSHIVGQAAAIYSGVDATSIIGNHGNLAVIDMTGCAHCTVENVNITTENPQTNSIPKTGISISRNPAAACAGSGTAYYCYAGNNTIRNVSVTGYFQDAAFYAVESELLTLEHFYGYVHDSAYYPGGVKPKYCMAFSQTDWLGLGMYASTTMTMGSIENSECWYYPTGVSGSAAIYFGGGNRTEDWSFRNVYLAKSNLGSYIEIQTNENSAGSMDGPLLFDNVDGEFSVQGVNPNSVYYIHGPGASPQVNELYIIGGGIMGGANQFINATANLDDAYIDSQSYMQPGAVSSFATVWNSTIKLPYQNTTIANAYASTLEGGASSGCGTCGLTVSGTNTSIVEPVYSTGSLTLNSPAFASPSFTGTMAGATYNSTGGYQLNGAGVLTTDGSSTNIGPVVAGHNVAFLNGSCAATQPASGPFNANCGLANNNGTLLPSTLTGYHGTGAGDVKVQLSDGTGTSTHLAAFDANGGLTDGGAPGSLPGTVVQTNQANAYSTGLQDFSAATMKLPSSVTVGSNSITMPSSAGTLALTSQTITLAGDVTGTQSATTVGKINGGSVPASANATSTNSSSQIIASTSHNLSVPAECAAASGSGTTYTCSTSPTFTPAAGDHIQFKADVANTGSATLAVNGATAATIKKWGGSGSLIANDLLAGHWISATFDGTYWQLEGQLGNANATQLNSASIPASANATSTNSSSQIVASTSHNLSVPAECAAASGSGTTYTCSTSPTFTPAAGDHIQFKADVANTGSATLNINGGGAATIYKWGNTSTLVAGDLQAGHWISATYDGSHWQLEGQLGNANATQLNGASVPASAPLMGTNSNSQLQSVTTLPTSAMPALTGDVTNTAGSLTTTVGKVNGASVPTSANALSSNSSSQLVASTSHNLSVPANCVAASGSGTAYTCTTSPTFTPATGDHIQFKADVANTGAATLSVNGATAASIKKWGGGTNLIANDLLAGNWISATYDGTYWQLEGQLGNANATQINGTSISGLSGSGSTLALTTSPAIASPTLTGTVTTPLTTAGVVTTTSGGVLGSVATTGSGSAVLATSPAIASPTLTGTVTTPLTTAGVVTTTSGGVLGSVATTGSGSAVLATSPTLVTPTLGAASATSLSLTNPLTVANGGTGAATASANTAFGNFTTSSAAPSFTTTTGTGSPVAAISPTFTGNTTTFANNSASTDYVVIQPGTSSTAELGGIQLNSAAASPVTEWYIEEDASYDLKIHDQGATTAVDILTGYINAGTNINSQGTSAVTINNASSGAGTGGFIVYEGGANYNIQAFTVTSSGNASVPGTLTATGTITGGMGASLSSATSIAATSFTSTGLALAAIPVSTTKRGMCVLIWEQNTAVGTVQFGMGMNNAPTNLWVINQDSPGTYKAPTYTTIASTTTTAVSAADAPSATATGYRDEIEFTLTTGSSNAVTVTVYGLSSSTSDALVIEPGSYCTWLP
jgi:hypothetical protein